MKRLYLLPLILVSSLAGAADIGSIQKEIDQTVWKPFKDAFENLDGEALNAVYAEEVLRVTPEAGLDTSGHFKQTNRSRFDANIANGDRIQLDFWFDSRHTSASTSYDVGFYRVRITTTGGTTSSFYGQFHIVLNNISGNWKIVQDWDTDQIGGQRLTAQVFERKTPVRF